jgi:SAM-dependent methyltransferase
MEDLRAWRARRAGAITCVDLGCGTGNNAAWLAPRLAGPQAWRLVDNDPGLLAEARERALVDAAGEPVSARVVEADLARDPAALVAGADLVTASALLDLVSERWLRAVAEACAYEGAAALFVLSYDGRFRTGAGGRVEARVRAAFNRDQRRDKGFGPALGPRAAPRAARVFRAASYRVRLARSPWDLGADAAPLQRMLVDGWSRVAREALGDPDGAIAVWADRQRKAIEQGEARIRVGHLDLFAAPPGTGP